MSEHYKNIWVPILIAIGTVFIILVILWLLCRHRRKNQFDYLPIAEDRSLSHKWNEEKRMQNIAERDTVLLNCYYYLKDSNKYSFIDHLPDIGSRIKKQWFLVHDSQLEKDVVLTLVPWNTQCAVSFTKGTKKTLKELFSVLQHPCLFPILDIDFVFDHKLVMFVHPFQSGGSLKDIIYGSNPKSSWDQKYQVKGKPLSLIQIRSYGRQVLEALLYLQEKGFPPCGHVHSGNIFIINGTSKLTGFENCLFGWKSRVDPIIKKLCKVKKADVDVIHFGHLMHEMLAGYELTTGEPRKEHLANFRNTEVVEVLNFIFFNESGMHPSLDELASHSFFKGGNLSELNQSNCGPVHFSSNVKHLLKQYRKGSEENQRRRTSSANKGKLDDFVTVNKGKKPSRSKNKRLSKGTGEKVAIAQFHQQSSSSAEIPPPPVKKAPPPPRAEKYSSIERVPPKPHIKSGRGGLLSEIQKGTKLKRTVTNDRSAPRV